MRGWRTARRLAAAALRLVARAPLWMAETASLAADRIDPDRAWARFVDIAMSYELDARAVAFDFAGIVGPDDEVPRATAVHRDMGLVAFHNHTPRLTQLGADVVAHVRLMHLNDWRVS